MDAEQLQAFREQLLALKQSLEELDGTARDASKPVELDQASVGRLSRMDAMQGQAMALETQRRKQIQLKRIAAALLRIESGDYGYCAECDEPIDPRRLKFDPTAPLCVECADKKERS